MSSSSTRQVLTGIIIIIVMIGVGFTFILFIENLPDHTTTTTTTSTTLPTTTWPSTTTTTGATTTTTIIQEQTITILTRHDVSIHNSFETAFLSSQFASDNHITDIIWRTPSPQFWDDQIDSGEVDVCWGGETSLYNQLMNDSRLALLTSECMQNVSMRVPETIAGVDMKGYDTEGNLTWIAASISSFGFTVNNQFLDDMSLPTPLNWTDLAKPAFGQNLTAIPTIAMGNAPSTTSNTRIYEIITQALGWDEGWINMARMAGNADIKGGSVETQTACENGAVGISMSIDFYGYLSQYRNPDCEYVLPDGQSVVSGVPIGIANSTSKQSLAEGFLDFVLSPYGQSLWLDNNIRRLPIMEDAFSQSLGLAEPDLYSVYNQTVDNEGIDFNETFAELTNSAFVYYWESVYTNAHDWLVDCWALMVEAYYDGHINATELDAFAVMMGTPVTITDPISSVSEKFTIDYALRINSDVFSNAAYRSDIQTAWTNAANTQYQAVYNAVLALIP